MVPATVYLEDWEDILDTLDSLSSRNRRFMRRYGVVNLYDGRFDYRILSRDKCGNQRWYTVKQVLAQPGPVWHIECEEAATILQAAMQVSGEDPNAKLRLIQVGDTAHVQVVSRGKVLDPSVRLGMAVPAALRSKIYDLAFKRAA